MPFDSIEKKRAYQREYAAKNREKLRAYHKAYTEARKDDPEVRAGNRRRVAKYLAKARLDPAWREHQRQKDRARRAKDPQKHRDRQAAYQKKNKEKVNAYYRRWCEANREEVRAYNREYSKAHRDPIKAAARQQRSRVGRRSGHHFTPQEWADRLEEFGHVCAFCLKPAKLTVEHLVDIHSGGGNEIENIVPACGSCNSRKLNRGLLYMATRIAA